MTARAGVGIKIDRIWRDRIDRCAVRYGNLTGKRRTLRGDKGQRIGAGSALVDRPAQQRKLAGAGIVIVIRAAFQQCAAEFYLIQPCIRRQRNVQQYIAVVGGTIVFIKIRLRRADRANRRIADQQLERCLGVIAKQQFGGIGASLEVDQIILIKPDAAFARQQVIVGALTQDSAVHAQAHQILRVSVEGKIGIARDRVLIIDIDRKR